MSDGRAPRPTLPPLTTTTRMFARSLGWSPEHLLSSFRPATAADLPALLAFRQRKGWDNAAYLRWRYGLDAKGEAWPGQLWLLHADNKARGGRPRSPAYPLWRPGLRWPVADGHPAISRARGRRRLAQPVDAGARGRDPRGGRERALDRPGEADVFPLPQRSYRVLPLDSAAMLRQRGVGGVGGVFARVGAPVLDAGWSLAHRLAHHRTHAGIDVAEVGQVPPAGHRSAARESGAADRLRAAVGGAPAVAPVRQSARALPPARRASARELRRLHGRAECRRRHRQDRHAYPRLEDRTGRRGGRADGAVAVGDPQRPCRSLQPRLHHRPR